MSLSGVVVGVVYGRGLILGALPPCISEESRGSALDEMLKNSISTKVSTEKMQTVYSHNKRRCKCFPQTDLQSPNPIDCSKLPPGTKVGDWFCAVTGGTHLLVLRPLFHQDRFHLVGIIEYTWTEILVRQTEYRRRVHFQSKNEKTLLWPYIRMNFQVV
jgi:hypothetical protein